MRLTSVEPPLVIASLESTSIGTGLSATVRSRRRVPVTMIACPGSRSSVAAGSSAAVGAALGCCASAAAGSASSASDDSDDKSKVRET